MDDMPNIYTMDLKNSISKIVIHYLLMDLHTKINKYTDRLKMD